MLLEKEQFVFAIEMNKFFVCPLLVIALTFGRQSTLAESFVKLTFVGDVFLDSTRLDRIDFGTLNGDIVLGNFEGVISTNQPNIENPPFKLCMSPPSINLFKQWGFTAFTLANNHTMDEGIEGYDRTKAALSINGFGICGLDDDGFVIRTNGVSIRIIGFSFSGLNSVNDIPKVKGRLSVFRENILVVVAHFGTEYPGQECPKAEVEDFEGEKRGNPIGFGHACIDSGASIVIGHGTHFLRPLESYKKRLIAYSLGDFLFTKPSSSRLKNEALSISVKIGGDGLWDSIEVYSYVNERGALSKDHSKMAFQKIALLSLGCSNLPSFPIKRLKSMEQK